MSSAGQPIRNVSDTALWTAFSRARESERADPLFYDPYARQLAGERGMRISAAIPFAQRNEWSFTARTYLFDQLILQEIHRGADLVVNLAAGLDTRPYRMALPTKLQWVEVDLPEILNYKEEILGSVTPVCGLDRVRLDLSDPEARRRLFEFLGSMRQRALILTEGLLIYFTPEAVAALARDLASPESFQRWILDLASPGLLRLMSRRMGREVAAAGAPFTFGPADGPAFFQQFGWNPLEVHPLLKTAARLHRLPWNLRLFSLLPQTHPGANLRRPWSGVCLFEKIISRL